jgi:hypothetical protein
MPPTSGVPNQPHPTHAFQMNLPTKPLFPAASSVLSQPPPSGPPPGIQSTQSGSSYASAAIPVGQPSTPTPSSSTSQQTVQPTGPLVPPTNTTARIIHPPEDISLEELRSRHPKYQAYRNNFSHNHGITHNDNNGIHTFKQEVL